MPPLVDPNEPWWLQGNFAPVTREVERSDLDVVGEIPPDLNGLYVRNGSNATGADNGHWFVGDGMLHGVSLEEGRAAWYRNRWVQTSLHASGGGLGDGPPGDDASFSNVSVFHHADRMLTSGELGLPYEVSPADLSTVGVYDFDGRLGTAMTAHPKVDPETGYLHFFGYSVLEAPWLTYHVADEQGRLVSSQPVDMGGPTMIHDFAITDRDVVFWEFPVVFDLERAMEGGDFPFSWDPSYGARIGVMPLGGPTEEITWVEVPPAYVFHSVNAYRDGDQIVVDVAQFETMFEKGPLGDAPELHRWHLDLSQEGSIGFRDELIGSDHLVELPTRDPRRVGRRHRYGWLVENILNADSLEFAGLLRKDFDTGAEQYYDPGPGRSANEGLFVPTGEAEDDGWVLTYVYDAARDGSDLVIVDAADLEAGAVATVALPQRVPYGFHGTFVPA